MAKNTTVLDDKLHWYKDAIIYELHIKAFRDSNGDGIGDFQGLFEKLDYLQELGVTAIWLLPFYPSPLKDDGYDIADYYSINPSYGNIEQFKLFLDEAHKRNLKVITELVINHSSDQHPWFQRARTSPKGSPERDFYVWTDDPNQYKDVRIIFQDFEASNWTWDPVAQQYYWHRFFHHQPDLNYDNPLVQDEIFKILDYWCEMGVDGFRLDAVPYLYEREGTNGENLPETHEFLKKLRAHIDERYPGTTFLAEANMWPEDSASYFGDGDECHMNYHFPVMPRMFMALQMEDRYPITDIFDQTPAIPDTCQWAIFLRNHDELTLEMVTDEERDYMYKVYAKDPKAKINLGIRHRLAPLMDNSRARIELMNSLLFSLPGTPVVYYGDEIGMGDNFYLGDRDGVRTPMQWSSDRNAGFSSANPHKLYLPVILDPEYHYESVNVELQRGNTSSLYWYMKRIINMRKKYKAFSRGDMKFINVENPKVLAFTRSHEDETLLIIVNLSKYSQPAEVHLADFKGYTPIEVFSKNRFPVVREDSPYFVTLGPHSYQWFALQKPAVDLAEKETLLTVMVNSWDDLLSSAVQQELENMILPAYLLKAKWFNNRGRSIYSITILKDLASLDLDNSSVLLLLLEVTFESGLPELYQVPVTFVRQADASALITGCPESVLCELKVGPEEGYLLDAFYTTDWQQALITKMSNNERLTLKGSNIHFYSKENLKNYLQGHIDIKPKVHITDTSNTSITYNNYFFLRMYRKLDRSINPDLEVSRYLSEQARFEHVPAYAGAIEWRFEKDTIVLGTMQLMIENHGDGYGYMLERINNYIERILARDRSTFHPEERIGSIVEPVAIEDLPEDLRVLLGGTASEHARLLGVRTAEMHKALASGSTAQDFKPEDFSLHYQRSLFASMSSLVRETYQSLDKNLVKVPTDIRKDVEEIAEQREDVLRVLKRIYNKKLDVVKVRIHGNYNLKQVLLTGKDVAIQDFGGDPTRTYSERRLKRSPLRDVASMIRSFHYVAYDGFLTTDQVQQEEMKALLPFADMWAFYMSTFFTKAYFDAAQGSPFIPDNKQDLEIMLQTYLLEIGVQSLNYELSNRPDWAMVPTRIIKSILSKQEVNEFA